MAIGPITMGANRPSWVVTILRTDNTALDITGASFTGCLFDVKSANRITLTPANYSITNATNGIFTYAPTITEVGTPGVWDFETILTIASQQYIVTVPNVKITERRAA